ncbi:MAG: hypothetical protein ACLSA6_14800 [Holdemania massiliensis]
MLIGWCIRSLGYVVDIERWGTVISLVMMLILLLRWARSDGKEKASVPKAFFLVYKGIECSVR